MLVFYIIAAILVVLLALVAVVNRAVVWEASRSEIYDCNKEINIDKKYHSYQVSLLFADFLYGSIHTKLVASAVNIVFLTTERLWSLRKN